MTSSNPHLPPKGPISKYQHIGGSELQHVNLGMAGGHEHQLVTPNKENVHLGP